MHFRLSEYLKVLENYQKQKQGSGDAALSVDNADGAGTSQLATNSNDSGVNPNKTQDKPDDSTDTITQNEVEDPNENGNLKEYSTPEDNESDTSKENRIPEDSSEKTDQPGTSKDKNSKLRKRSKKTASARKKSKINISLSNRRFSLKLQVSTDAETQLPNPNTVTPEEVEEVRIKYDLPKFPPRKKMGKATIFDPIEEQQMMVYLKDMKSMDIPRTMDQFQREIKFFYNTVYAQNKKKKGHTFGTLIFLFLH